jgi:hypothetical protein
MIFSTLTNLLITAIKVPNSNPVIKPEDKLNFKIPTPDSMFCCMIFGRYIIFINEKRANNRS